MDDKLKVSSILSVSGKNMKNCETVIKTLQKMSVNCDVTENTTIICNDVECWKEKGCRILIHNVLKHDIKKIWNKLKIEHKFECAYYKLNGGTEGCIYDYMSNTQCPGS